MKKSDILFSFFRIVNDGAMIFFALLLSYYIRMVWFETFHLEAPVTLYPYASFLDIALNITICLLLMMALSGRYKMGSDEKVFDEFFHIISSLSVGMALIIVFFFFVKFIFFSRFIFASALVIAVVLVFLGRLILRLVRWQLRKRGIGKRKVLILGCGGIAQKLVSSLDEAFDYDIKGILTEGDHKEEKEVAGINILGKVEDLETILEKYHIEEVYLATETPFKCDTDRLAEIAYVANVKFRILPDELSLDLASVEVSTINGLPILTLLNTPLQGWMMVMKSFCDRVLASLIILGISPVLVFITLRIWFSDPFAPIFYISRRVGRKGEIFPCLKFRTMVPDADKKKQTLLEKNQREGGVFFKLENDPRITKFGKLLREWSLDELPQLLNVLKGDMSLIGPRPHLPEEVDKYHLKDRRVLSIKPGMTGFAQINGRSSLSFEEEMKYELFYVKNWSLWLDLVIFMKSVWVVIKRQNAT